MYMQLEALTCKCSLQDQLHVFVPIQYIRQEFSEYKEEKIVSTILFEDDAITHDLPLDPVNGWKIFPLSHPKVIHVVGDCSVTG